MPKLFRWSAALPNARSAWVMKVYPTIIGSTNMPNLTRWWMKLISTWAVSLRRMRYHVPIHNVKQRGWSFRTLCIWKITQRQCTKSFCVCSPFCRGIQYPIPHFYVVHILARMSQVVKRRMARSELFSRTSVVDLRELREPLGPEYEERDS